MLGQGLSAVSDPAVRVMSLGKQYRLGTDRAAPEMLRERLAIAARGFGQRLRRGWRGERRGRDDASTIWALHEVSFDVGAGEIVGIIGGNGAGKSTLLKILSRITAPTTGRAEIRGRVASLLEVGTGFHPDLTGRENIFLNGAILGMKRQEIHRKLDAIVEFAEVERFLDTTVKHYSSGMYLRLAFAVAAHLEPEILIIDEVLAVGDARFQRKCLGKIDAVARGGRTVLFVSHNMAAVQRLCTTAMLLDRGRVVFRGDPRATVARYLAEEGRVKYQATMASEDPQVLEAELVTSSGASMARACITDPIAIRMRVRLPGQSGGTRCGIGILAADGTTIFTSNLDDVEMDIPPGPCEFEAMVTIPADTLLAGEYHVVTCLWNEFVVIDLQEPAFSFSADTGPSPLYRRSPDRKGFVNVQCHWSIAVPVAVAVSREL
jgi:lipopolysaccharide transport system ATP-binding protein